MKAHPTFTNKIFIILISTILFTGCGSSPSPQVQSNQVSSDTAESVHLPEPEIPPLPDPKDFEELLGRYDTQTPPYTEGKDDLTLIWIAHPENLISDAVLDRFFLGTPAFPAEYAEDTLVYYSKLKLKSGHWMLLTMEESYGQTLYASIFDEKGNGKSSMRIFRHGKLPTTIETLLTFMIFEDEHFELYSEHDLGDKLERDTLRYFVDDSGVIQPM